MREPLDPDIVYKVGCGKKHGRHFLANGFIDSRASASQSRSRSDATEDNIRPSTRIKTPVDRIVDLEVKVDGIYEMLRVSLLTRTQYSHILICLF
jgi:hypothetical protein